MTVSDLGAARLEMAISLAFHIVFATVGIAMPAFMVVAEVLAIKGDDPIARELAKRWAKGTALFFAVGAVSGTVLSFELGLLWPRFMSQAGSVVGLPFALEGFAFFAEAIFLGVYLYGRERLAPKVHALAGGIVALSGLASGVFVVCANAWMNAPAGFRLEGQRLVATDPIAALLNPAALHEVVHVVLSVFAAGGFAVAGIHARQLLQDPASGFHRRALAIALSFGGGAALLLPLSGDASARAVARLQPAKLAALEGHWKTERGAPLRIFGWPDLATQSTPYAIEVPRGLSLLAFHDPDAEVLGLDAFPPDERPDPVVCHLAFQVMVGAGSWLAFVAAWGAVRAARRRWPWESRAFLKALVVSMPLGFVALEAGWIVTEVGRQPWIVHGVLRTKDAVTSVRGLRFELVAFVAVYAFLAAVVAALVRGNVAEAPRA